MTMLAEAAEASNAVKVLVVKVLTATVVSLEAVPIFHSSLALACHL